MHGYFSSHRRADGTVVYETEAEHYRNRTMKCVVLSCPYCYWTDDSDVIGLMAHLRDRHSKAARVSDVKNMLLVVERGEDGKWKRLQRLKLQRK